MELTKSEVAYLQKTYGCAPRVFLLCKGPGETEWSKLSSLTYDNPNGKAKAFAEMNHMQEAWVRQGLLLNHSFKIASFADSFSS